VVLDDIIPVREKYRPPSPLPERAPSLSVSPKGRSKSRSSVSATRKSTFVTKPSDPSFIVDITYSPDSNMVHRFINFEISPHAHEKVAVALQKYISITEQDDQGAFMYHQIQETYEEKLTTGAVTGSRDFSGKPTSALQKQITLVMVMDPDSCHPNAFLRNA
jgi:hypothetical protein